MPKVITQEQVSELHEEMLELQEQIAPFIPTVTDLKKVWNMYAGSQVNRMLKRMYEAGMVKVRVSGNSIQYFAVRKEGMNGKK